MRIEVILVDSRFTIGQEYSFFLRFFSSHFVLTINLYNIFSFNPEDKSMIHVKVVTLKAIYLLRA